MNVQLHSSNFWYIYFSTKYFYKANLFYPYNLSIFSTFLCFRSAPFSVSTLFELPESLEVINLCGTRRLTLDILECFLLNHYQMTDFRLSRFHILQQSTIDILSNLVSLVVLEISFVIADDVDLSPLANLINLEELYLQSNSCLQDSSFRLICQTCTSLRVLNVSACKRLFDHSALAYCKNVKQFYCSNTVQICDDDLCDLARNCSLEYISLIHCPNVSNIGVLEIARLCPLREICIAQCPDVTDACLIQLVDNHRPIDVISVQNCKITNDGIRALAKVENLLYLQELDVSYNRTVNEASLIPIYQTLVERLGTDAQKRLTIYVHQTAVTRTIERLVQSHIRLVFWFGVFFVELKIRVFIFFVIFITMMLFSKLLFIKFKNFSQSNKIHWKCQVWFDSYT